MVMGFFEKHKKTGYGVFITSTIREQKTYTPSPFPAFTLRRRRQLPSSPQGFLLPASYLTNFWAYSWEKWLSPCVGFFLSAGRSGSWLKSPAPDRMARTTSNYPKLMAKPFAEPWSPPVRIQDGRKGRRRWDTTAGCSGMGGSKGGEAPLAYYAFAKQRHSKLSRIYIRDHGYTMLRVEIYFVDNKWKT